MFQFLRRRLRDVRTLSMLCIRAQEIAHHQGRPKPGSEHFILAALSLPDQTASQAFSHMGITEQMFQNALSAQRNDALASIGAASIATDVDNSASDLPLPNSVLYEAEPSGQTLVKRLADTRQSRAARYLVGADVLLAAAQENHTPSMRAFQKLGISASQLASAAQQSIKAACHHSNA